MVAILYYSSLKKLNTNNQNYRKLNLFKNIEHRFNKLHERNMVFGFYKYYLI